MINCVFSISKSTGALLIKCFIYNSWSPPTVINHTITTYSWNYLKVILNNSLNIINCVFPISKFTCALLIKCYIYNSWSPPTLINHTIITYSWKNIKRFVYGCYPLPVELFEDGYTGRYQWRVRGRKSKKIRVFFTVWQQRRTRSVRNLYPLE